MRKAILPLLLLMNVSAPARAVDDPNRVTIPAAASIVGAAPFFSDVRAFNASYEATISVTASYHCFLGSCPGQIPQVDIVLAPRSSEAFNDMVAVAFGAPNSAGGIEFEVTAGGTAADIGVTSRLYSTAPTPTVGMFIPGVFGSAAHSITFLGQISNGGSGKGFRTNAGAFNPEDTAVTAKFSVFDDRGAILGSEEREIPAHSGVQINNIFGVIGRASLATDDAVIVVTATGDLFTYAAVIDNNTTDPSFIAGAEDRAVPPSYTPPAAATTTPTPPQPTPTAPAPTPTPTPSGAQMATVSVGQGGLNFVDQSSGSNVTTIHVGDTVRWVWAAGFHSTTSGSCSGGCREDGRWDSGEGSGKTFSRTFTQPGTFEYYCTVHGAAMTGVVQVQ
jgi:plastocyanin